MGMLCPRGKMCMSCSRSGGPCGMCGNASGKASFARTRWDTRHCVPLKAHVGKRASPGPTVNNTRNNIRNSGHNVFPSQFSVMSLDCHDFTKFSQAPLVQCKEVRVTRLQSPREARRSAAKAQSCSAESTQGALPNVGFVRVRKDRESVRCPKRCKTSSNLAGNFDHDVLRGPGGFAAQEDARRR